MKNKKQKVEQQISTNFDNMNSDSDEDDEGHFDLLSHSIQEEEEDNLIKERNKMFYYYYRMDVKNIEKLLDERGIIFNSGLNKTKKCQLLLGEEFKNSIEEEGEEVWSHDKKLAPKIKPSTFRKDIQYIIINQTLIYIDQKGETETMKKLFPIYPYLTNTLIRIYISVVLFLGKVKLSNISEAWSNGSSYLPFVANSITENQFKFLSSHIHFADNKNENSNKLYKIQDIIDKTKIVFIDNFPPVKDLVIDEDIVPTKNKSKGLRQYVAKKPNKWGYKIWKLVASNGYLINFDVYKGKGSIKSNEKTGEMVVKQLLNDKFFNKGYCLFTDNYFTSVKNSIYLKSLKVDTVGVTKESKKNLPDFLFEEILNKHQFDWAVHLNYDISVLRICDKKEFMMVQTIIDPTTEEDYKSNSMERMNSEPIKLSSVLVSYRMNMGACDRQDQRIKKEFYSGHNKKWYLTLFWYIIECYIVNSFVVHKNYNKYSLSYREFRKTILEDLNGHQTLRKYAPSSTFSNFSTFFQIFQRKNNEKN
ncbi:hypothetical protein ACTFIW_011222 [Dictyostelium discoideum]